ncbi:hypothetical protein [Streptomyces sp. NPDC008122]
MIHTIAIGDQRSANAPTATVEATGTAVARRAQRAGRPEVIAAPPAIAG